MDIQISEVKYEILRQTFIYKLIKQTMEEKDK